MKSMQEFTSYYTELVKNDAELAEKQKNISSKTSHKSIFKFFGFLWLIGIAGLFLLYLLSGSTDVLIASGIFGATTFLMFFPISLIGQKIVVPYLKKRKAILFFEEKYKERLVTYLLDDKIFSYKHEEKIDEKLFKESNMFSYFNRYYGEDLVTIVSQSSHGDIVINFSDIDAVYVSTDKDGTNRRTVFDGTFGVCYLPKPLNFTMGINTRKGEKVTFESEDFNKRYKVYCTDQISARLIFTPDRMEKLLPFENKILKTKYVHVNGNKIYFGFSGSNLFSAHIENSVNKISALDFYEDVKQINFLIELLLKILEDIY